jgi:ABC-2 type transport system ATP-binding protein
MVDALDIRPADTVTPAIEFRNLSRQFGSSYAVYNVSFSVMPGEVVGYIGPNGAGKTTSMRILATLDDPTSGDAFVQGFSVIDDPDRVRLRIGFMPDDFGTYPYVDCEEYLDFFARAYGLRDDERRQAVRRVVEFTGLGPLLRKPIDKLSKGMKQRLCLGRALIHDPDVLILDEPAAGLDPRARIELRDMVSRLAAEGKALLISSHILTELGEMCNRLAILEAGRLLACGSVEEILRSRRVQASEIQVAEVVHIEMESLEGTEVLANWLTEQQDVQILNRDNETILFSYVDDPAQHAQLLKRAIEAGNSITRFSARKRTLEQAFMELTAGLVQ